MSRLTAGTCAAATAALTILTFAPGASAAKMTTITGSIKGGAGYSVIVTTTNGGGTRQKLGKSGKFTLRLRASAARGSTLTVVQPNGRYLGPVVLGHTGRTAYIRMGGSSLRLGRLTLRSGYATPGITVPEAAIQRSATANANRAGKPVGAGRLGLVISQRRKKFFHRLDAAVTPPKATAGLGSDPDGDGIPNAFDVDDDGDLVLDSVDPNAGNPNNQPVTVFTNLKVGLLDSINVNAGNVTADQIDTLLKSQLWMTFQFAGWAAGQTGVSSVNVDCSTLTYCAPGAGTATIFDSPNPPAANEPTPLSLWTSFDPDGDGFPNLTDVTSHFGGGQTGMFGVGVNPHATRAQVNPGDAYTFLVKSAQGASSFTTTLPPYFVTTPAIVSIQDSSGVHTIGYPVQPGDPGTESSATAPGDHSLALTSDSVTINVWRPQRPAIPGAETGTYRDIGGLRYVVSAGGAVCQPAELSSLSSTLSNYNDGAYDMLQDSAKDAVPSAGNVMSFTVNLGSCLSRTTEPMESRTAGFRLGVEGRTAHGDNAGQRVRVTLP